jgi:serine/threonine-protein kinase
LVRETIDSGTADTPTGTGELIAGRYRIVRWLGAGGMGSVYRAFDTELGEHVALKMLHRGLSSHALERFRREVKLTRRVVHRNIARMFDIGDHEGERFLTLELIDGAPLSRLLLSPLPWPEVHAIANDICAGLEAVHRAGIVHRDLKPDNVIVAIDGRAVVTDFGIARATDDMSTTQLGTMIGTPTYMAPEQIEGDVVDARADIFSLGVLLFELASCHRPWEASTPLSLAVAITTKPPRSLRTLRADVPANYVAIVEQCLQAEPAKRPTIDEVVRALAAAPPVSEPPMRDSAARIEAVPVRATTIAVRAFDYEPDLRHVAAELIDDIVNTLTRQPGIRVRVSTIEQPRGPVDPQQLGRDLGVEHVVEGSIRRGAGDELRVSARLVGVSDGFQIWAERIVCTERELLLAPHTLTNGIVTALSSRGVAPPRPADPRAAELYLRARAEIRRYWGSHVLTAVKLLEEAAALAPDSVPIHATLALASVRVWVLREDPHLEAAAKRALDRATALDPQRRETWMATALYHMNIGDMRTAAYELGAALARAPMAAAAHDAVGKMLLELGELDEARQRLATAIGLEPERRPMIEAELARVDELGGDHTGAEARIQLLLDDPDPALQQVGMVYFSRTAAWRGDLSQFGASLAKIYDRRGEATHSALAFVSYAVAKGEITRVAWEAQLRDAVANHRPTRARLVWVQILAEVASALGQYDLALEAATWCASSGLFDVLWLRQCPPMRVLATRQPEAVARLAEMIETRAAQMLAAFRRGMSEG